MLFTLLRRLAAAGLASLLWLLPAASAQAGLVQWAPLFLLNDIFTQSSVLKATGGVGIALRLPQYAQTLYSRYTDLDPYANGNGPHTLEGLVAASGLANSLTIPLFYIDSFPHTNVVGLGALGNNGVALLTSAQTRLNVAPGYRDYASCTADHGYPCWYEVPEVTLQDVYAGVWRSAEIVAHEVLHNLGLGHSPAGLMTPWIPSLNAARDPTSWALTDAEVQQMLESPYLQTNSRGYRYIDLAVFSVQLAVPEPDSLALAVLALCAAVSIRATGGHRTGSGPSTSQRQGPAVRLAPQLKDRP